MTTRIEALRALQARIRESSEPERELDAKIAAVFLGGEIEWKQANYTMDLHPVRKYASTMHVGGFGRDPVYRYTASLDACVALMAAVLPGWTRHVDATAPEHGIEVQLYPPDDRAEAISRVVLKVRGDHNLETHAHLLAIFSAVIAELEARKNADV